MTILHIVPDDALGGGAVIVARLLEVAEAAAPERQVAVLPENAEPRLRALFAPLPHRFGRFRGRGPLLGMARAILEAAGEGDVVHAHGTRAALAAALAALARPRLAIVYTVHGFHGLAKPDPLGWRLGAERLLARRVQATAFVSASDRALAEARGLRYRGPARVIENGLPGPPTAPEGARDVDLLFVGRLVHQKWPEAFVETVAQVPGAPRVTMVGAGELAERVDALAADRRLPRFERLDGLDHPRVLELMGRTRVLVMTSRWEGLPTVAIEAMLSGCVPAGFDIPPLREALGPAADALLTPPEPAALAARLGGLLADEPERRRIAAGLGASARERYDQRRMAARYGELYAAARAGAARAAA